MFIDHVIYGVTDVDEAAERLRRDYGLGSLPGGRHLGGTTNRLIPLEPPTFLELLGVGDTSKGDAAWLEATLKGRDRPIWWALGVDDIQAEADRLGMPVHAATMQFQEGGESSFRVVGMPLYPLPFFIRYGTDWPERRVQWAERLRRAKHDVEPGTFTFVEVGGVESQLHDWIGSTELPMRVVDGYPGIRSVGIEIDGKEIVLGSTDPSRDTSPTPHAGAPA